MDRTTLDKQRQVHPTAHCLFSTLALITITLGLSAAHLHAQELKVSAPQTAVVGASMEIGFSGSTSAGDFITVVSAAPDKEYDHYVYTKSGSPAELLAPEAPGEYELRYLTGQSYAVLARRPIEVTAVTASVSGPAEAEALSVFSVRWEGAGNPQDYVIIRPVGSQTNADGPYAYTHRGPELRITVPKEPGDYEYRYLTGQTQQRLASQRLRVFGHKEADSCRTDLEIALGPLKRQAAAATCAAATSMCG